MLYTHRPYWKHHAARCVLSIALIFLKATQTTYAQTRQDITTPDPAWLSAYQQTLSPTQAPSATGSRHHPSPHGPFSQTLNQGIPKRAYTPFEQATIECPAGECQFKDNIILVKLKPESDHAAKMDQDITSNKSRSTTEEQIAGLMADLPIAQIEPVFQDDPQRSRSALIETPEGDLIPRPDLSRWHRIELDPKATRAWARTTDDASSSDQNNKSDDPTLQTVLQELRRRPEIEYAEPDYIYKVNGEPVAADFYSDPELSQQWHLGATNIPKAWDFLDTEGLNSGGNPDIVVAVIDTGVDYTHPDLINSMWVNPGEFNTASNQDNDGNGYRDDIHGARVIGNSLSGDPMDDHGHGTHVAGIIAAHGNNGQGGVGVAPNVKIMAIKAAQYSGILSSTDVARGIEYAMDNGADIINMSFGSYARSQLMEDALANAFGTTVLVAAAGNDARANLSCPSEHYPRRANMYPAAFNWVIGVMAQNQTADGDGDRLAGFSNFDCRTQDGSEYEVMAPGVGIYSTLPFGGYGAWSGTSMATPIVAGVAALARTYWSDKSIYSSRFIMGQLAATGPSLQAHTHPLGGITQWASMDAHSSLTTVPTPSLQYLEHWAFDTTSIDPDNNPNGRIESGETIDLALVIRNHWGKADNVSVTLEAKAPSAV
ncbi:MAG TPA: S8 family peptidase, partial [Wenzhouxiangella sp.]